MGFLSGLWVANFPLLTGKSLNIRFYLNHEYVHTNPIYSINYFLQLIGFATLLTGMSCYNNIVIPQLVRKCRYRLGRHRPPASDRDRIINTAADDIPDSQ